MIKREGNVFTFVAASILAASVLLAVVLPGCGDDFREAKMTDYSCGDSCLARNVNVDEHYGEDWKADVEVSVDGLRIFVTHKNAIFNCCLETIVVKFRQDGDLLVLKESEVATVPCDCVCPFEIKATIEVPHRGTYVLEIYSGVELVWRQEVVV